MYGGYYIDGQHWTLQAYKNDIVCSYEYMTKYENIDTAMYNYI